MKIKWSDHKPSPGSDAAVEVGCTCPVMDNAHGNGVPWPREDGKDPKDYPSFWINESCPIHTLGKEPKNA